MNEKIDRVYIEHCSDGEWFITFERYYETRDFFASWYSLNRLIRAINNNGFQYVDVHFTPNSMWLQYDR